MPSVTVHQIEDICGRCGKKAIRKFIEEKETDGGYTRYKDFESRGKGWDYVFKAHSHATKRDGDVLCPECCILFNQRFDEFMSYTRSMTVEE